MQNIYDKKWFWGLWEYYGCLVIEIFYETTWKWTVYFKYINLWAFDVVLPLCHDIGDCHICVTIASVWRPCLCGDPVCVTTLLCGIGWGFWFWNGIGYFYGSQWIIYSFIVTLRRLVLQYVYHSCYDVKEIYFAEFKWKFPNFSMFVKCSLSWNLHFPHPH